MSTLTLQANSPWRSATDEDHRFRWILAQTLAVSLALGASAVCLGRPYAYALALAGEAGVREYLLNMMADFELTMGLAGCKSLEEINRACLRPEQPF